VSSATPSNQSPPSEVPGGSAPAVLIVVPWLGHGGADQVALDILQQLVATGHRVIVACTDPARNERLTDASAAGAEVWELPRLTSAARVGTLLVNIAHRSGAEIVHIINSRPGFDSAMALRELRPRPAIVGHLVGEEGPGGGFPAYVAALAAGIDLFICVSEDLTGVMRDHGIAPDRMAVVRPAIDTQRFQPATAQVGRVGPLRVIMPARLSHEKDPLLAIDSIAAARLAGIDVTLTLTGDGPMRSEVEDAARRPGVAGHVTVAGVVDDMDEQYRRHDVVLLTSRFEAVPLAICEGMASGLPVVAPRVGGIPEIVDATCGMLVDDRTPTAFARALADVADHTTRVRMGEASRRRAEELLSAEAAASALNEAWARARSMVA
jgi:glycosyltransferase involved in cell wall biosynthesis